MNNSLLYCSGCTSTGAWLSPLQTGILTGAYQLGKLQVHSSSRPRKKLNGRFPSLDPDDYVEAMRQIGHSGVSAIEPCGLVNGYLRDSGIHDQMERSGVPIGRTNIRMAVCVNLEGTGHGFGYSGITPYGCVCSGCGTPI
jgi:hypothetical protein